MKKKNPKFSGENSVLTDKNQRLLIQKLEKASKQSKKSGGGRKKFVSSSSDDGDSSDVGESKEGESFTV